MLPSEVDVISNKNQRGFTLIELVIVIVLIGILAATALPKFASLTGQARISANEGVGGAMGAAVAIAHAQWIATGSPTTITLEGSTVGMSTGGWPENNTGTIDGTMTVTKCEAVWTAILNNPPSVGGGDYTTTIVGGNCVFTDADSNTITYNATSGAVTIS